MESRKKTSEQGWFYHAPPKKASERQMEEQVGVPPTSQIPGLSNLPPQPDIDHQSIRGTIKDTDSPYVILAKEGGRKDLLVFKDRKPVSNEPKGYPRVDWFYLEDNRMEDQAQNGESNPPAYQPSMPEYMVHEHLLGHEDGPDRIGGNPIRKRAPYSFGNDTIFDREGKNATNKTIAIDEMRMPGYGVRQEKMKDKVVKYNTVKPPRGKAPTQEMAAGQHFSPCPTVDETERPNMGKILSFGYAQDWRAQRDEWENNQGMKSSKTAAPMPQIAAEGTEYQGGFQSKQDSASRVAKAGRRAGQSPSQEMTSKPKAKVEEEKPDFFKMKRFQNIPAKTDTHRIFKKMAAAT